MPPKRTTAHARAQSIAALSPNEPFVPAADAAAFRDLLIFEERLKQNALRLQSRKRKYEVLLTSFILLISWISYFVWLKPRDQNWLQYVLSAVLMICMVTLFLFFASGMHADRIRSANKFVPQANRSLRVYNMYLNTKVATSARWWAWLSLKFLTTTSSNTKTIASATSQRKQTASIPPSQNTRGELIFSTKVDTDFREGYEKYRAAFERRRAEKMAAKRALSWKRWLDKVWPRTATLQVLPPWQQQALSTPRRTQRSRRLSKPAEHSLTPKAVPKKLRSTAEPSEPLHADSALLISSSSETELESTKQRGELDLEHDASSASDLDDAASGGSSLSGHEY